MFYQILIVWFFVFDFETPFSFASCANYKTDTVIFYPNAINFKITVTKNQSKYLHQTKPQIRNNYLIVLVLRIILNVFCQNKRFIIIYCKTKIISDV